MMAAEGGIQANRRQKGDSFMELAEIPTRTYTEEDYYSLPENVRAELIDGQFYDMASPARIHQRILMEVAADIRNYIRSHGGSCEVDPAPFAVKLSADERTIVEPDISVICDPEKLTEKGCTGAPDWIVEIVSPSSRRIDYHIKLFKYQESGVKEYWIVDPEKKRILVFNFEHENTVEYTFFDSVASGIFDGLSIDFASIPGLSDL